jgi:large subunit ribosomal protein L28e
MVSSDVAWAVIRNNSAFLLKKRGVKKAFSTEALNLTNLNSQRYSGLVNAKAVGITAGPDNKGFVLTTKRAKTGHRPSKSLVKITMKAGPRRSLHKVKGALLKQRYRKDLSKAALRKASAIVRSQKPLPKRKGAKPAAAAAKKE